MSEAAPIADSAPAPDGAIISDTPASFSEPLGSQAPEPAAPVEPAKPASLDDTIDRAIAKSEAKQVEADKAKPNAKIDAKEPAKTEAQPRENGKFASTKPAAEPQTAQTAPNVTEPAKPSTVTSDAPARFSEDAKRDWNTAPETVRRESDRAIRELTQGIEKHKAEYEPLRPFAEMAKQSGTKLETALQSYVQTEQLLRQNPIKGLESICENLGVSLRQVAEHYLGQPSDQQQNAKDVELAQVKRELAEIKQGFTSFKGDLETREVQQTIHAFKADPKHTRFEELQPDIGMFLQTGRANTLSEAYQLAERLNPAANYQASASAQATSSVASDPAPVHPGNGQKSINGAPTPGLTSPSGKKRAALSLDDALDRAFGAAG